MYQKIYPTAFHLHCGGLHSSMRGLRRLDLVVFNGIEAAVTDMENGNQRPAKVSIAGDCVSCTFQHIIDYQLFEIALATHGFK